MSASNVADQIYRYFGGAYDTATHSGVVNTSVPRNTAIQT